MFQAYTEFSRKIHLEKSEKIISEPVFCNDNIQVGKTIVFFDRKWIDTGVCCIINVLTANGTFMSLWSFKETYGISTD